MFATFSGEKKHVVCGPPHEWPRYAKIENNRRACKTTFGRKKKPTELREKDTGSEYALAKAKAEGH